MKKKKYYLMALASLLMAACSEDMETSGPDEGNGGKDGRELTFLFSGTSLTQKLREALPRMRKTS